MRRSNACSRRWNISGDGPGNSVDPSRIAISWYVALGRLYDGLAAGRLCIKEPGLSTKISTPSVLFYAASSKNVR